MVDYGNEIWRDIPNYENLYQVSSFGRVRSLPRYKIGKNGSRYLYKGRILSNCSDGKYLLVLLHKDGIRVTRHIHRLVAEVFIPCNKKGLVINHIDENKYNNKVENLEWVTQRQNINHGTRNLRMAKTSLNRTDCSKPVFKCDKDGNIIVEYPSISEAARQMNIGVCAIQNCIRGRSKTSCGFIWKFKDEENY